MDNLNRVINDQNEGIQNGNSVSGLVNECGYRPPEVLLRCDWSPRRFRAFRWVAGARLVSQNAYFAELSPALCVGGCVGVWAGV